MAISQALRFTSRRFEEARQVLRLLLQLQARRNSLPKRVQIRQDLLDHAVLKAIDDASNQRIVEAAVELALERLLTGQERTASEDLKTKLAAEQDRKGILRRADSLNVRAGLDRSMPRKSSAIFAQLSCRREGAPFRQIPQARQMLRKLLVDRTDVRAVDDDGGRATVSAARRLRASALR